TTITGTLTCGGGGLVSPAPAAPFSGELDSDTGCTTKVSDLGLGCLNVGGGGATAVPPSKIPDGATNYFDIIGAPPNNLAPSVGPSQADCTKGAGPGMHCVGATNTGSACVNDGGCGGVAGACALDANCFFGPPLPIPNPFAGGVLTTCVLSVIQTDASGTGDAATGNSSVSLPLSSRVFVTGNFAEPCPKCVGKKCDTGPNAGAACVAVGSLATSLACPPAAAGFQAPLPVGITGLAPGSSTLPSAGGLFCGGQVHAGAFGFTTAKCIKETGSPAGDIHLGGAAVPSKLGASFCIPSTGNGTL